MSARLAQSTSALMAHHCIAASAPMDVPTPVQQLLNSLWTLVQLQAFSGPSPSSLMTHWAGSHAQNLRICREGPEYSASLTISGAAQHSQHSQAQPRLCLAQPRTALLSS